MIRSVTKSDASSIAEIYNYYVLNTVVTFEEAEVSVLEMASRIQNQALTSLPWLVLELEQQVIGYAYATPWKERKSYQYSVEITVYLKADMHAKGWGTRLYKQLIIELTNSSKRIHVVLAGISLPNPASIALHEKLGMKQVAEFKEIGFKLNSWVDTGYWQMTL